MSNQIESSECIHSRKAKSFKKIILTTLATSLFALASLNAVGSDTYASAPPQYQVVNTFSADGNPHFPGINSKTQRLYVSDVPAGTITMFDALSATKLIETATGVQTHTVLVDDENNLVYAVNRGSDSLVILNGDTNAVIGEVDVGDGPHGIDMDTENHRVFTSNTYSNTVTVIDTKTQKVIKTIPVGIEPWGVAYEPETGWLYVANTGEGSIYRMDIKTGKILKRFDVGGRPWNVKVSSKTGNVYATNETLGILSVMDKSRIIAEVDIGKVGRGLVLHEDVGLAFAVTAGSNQVTSVSLRTNSVVQNIAVGTGPAAATLDESADTLYVTNQGGGTISVIKRLH